MKNSTTMLEEYQNENDIQDFEDFEDLSLTLWEFAEFNQEQANQQNNYNDNFDDLEFTDYGFEALADEITFSDIHQNDMIEI